MEKCGVPRIKPFLSSFRPALFFALLPNYLNAWKKLLRLPWMSAMKRVTTTNYRQDKIEIRTLILPPVSVLYIFIHPNEVLRGSKIQFDAHWKMYSLFANGNCDDTIPVVIHVETFRQRLLMISFFLKFKLYFWFPGCCDNFLPYSPCRRNLRRAPS